MSIVAEPEINNPDLGFSNTWIVTAFNNDTNSFEQVIEILMKATGCSKQEADMETWEIHHLGKSVVHSGSFDECSTVGSIISSIGVMVEISEF